MNPTGPPDVTGWPKVVQAASRIMRMDYDDALSMGQRLDMFINDAEIVAGAIAQIAVTGDQDETRAGYMRDAT